tara:strand:+ start:82 stop:375 length:294 start_codon:yes stop_codon:yes gene_type:complete
MIYTDVQFQLPLSCLEDSYNYTIIDNALFGTWIPDLEEYCFDWLMWERESEIVDCGSDHWCEPDAAYPPSVEEERAMHDRFVAKWLAESKIVDGGAA